MYIHFAGFFVSLHTVNNQFFYPVQVLTDAKLPCLKIETGEFFCDPAGARTQDPILKRDVLYLLSY